MLLLLRGGNILQFVLIILNVHCAHVCLTAHVSAFDLILK